MSNLENLCFNGQRLISKELTIIATSRVPITPEQKAMYLEMRKTNIRLTDQELMAQVIAKTADLENAKQFLLAFPTVVLANCLADIPELAIS
ncbi:MAG: hypothetical protein UT13_C0001G0650 [Candidatus Pacebacteria bacterium GW2011_GWF2_38_9]|nr:MAG: hypothetical protein US01_C0001G0679 [candidate division TM6 bacterium GW2011_GWF2_28_16]KKQ08667.1 MAG: hypothetical protein US20_C0013G0017 [Candidatus Pacebacteria bacterium GW2011_GWF1_36_5]KKQ89003.1 MAG: hypothetical protein UT13_C0001G0650 [Candidatus Pacebacteria bacterium GW2011_GWF2_38_9]HAZ73179.1 hypothetical protein [Candidatus Paceibacterota bacterium]